MRIPTELKVVAIEDIATGVRALTFETIDSLPFPPWEPGAHLDLHIGDLRRQYSIARGDGRLCKIAVLRDENSRGGSDFVHDRIDIGHRIPLAGIRNNFVFNPEVSATGVTFIAGGIGITPILPMLADAVYRGLEVDVYYGARTRERMAFRAEIVAAGTQPGVTVHLMTDDVDGPIAFAEAINGRPRTDPVYCCGPAGLIEAVSAAGAAAGREVHSELFRVDTDNAGDEFTVSVDDSQQQITIPPGTSLIETLRDQGYDVPSSCEEGTCGTCELRVISGDIDHRDHVLSQSERDAGDCIIACVSRARGILTIEI